MPHTNASTSRVPILIGLLIAALALFFGWVLFVQLRVPETGLAL